MYVCMYVEMVDFGEYDKMIKTCGKVGKSNTMNLVVIFRSLFKEELLQTNFFGSFYIPQL